MRHLDKQSLLFLVLGGLFGAMASGQGSIAVAAWLAPICLLRFVHIRPSARRVLILWPVTAAALLIVNRKVVPFPAGAYVTVMVLSALTIALVYFADYKIAPYMRGFAATLIFPAAWTAMEYLSSFLAGRATWGDMAYTQGGNVALMQLASITGVYGISFLIAWTASVLNWAWDRDFNREAMRGLAACATVLAIVIVGGAARLAFAGSASHSVRAAVISTPRRLFDSKEAVCVLEGRVPANQRATTDAKLTSLQNWFLDHTLREARAGAKLVVWPEWGLMIHRDDEAAFIARAQRLAAEEHIYLLMGMATTIPGASRPVQNKAVLIDPSGAIAFVYLKHLLVPGMEATITNPGDGRMPLAATPFGRITAAICYEGDFPNYIRQASGNGAEILLLPTNDWRGIENIHLEMASFRAVETGVTMIRANSLGISAVVDAYGRVIAATDHASPDAPVMVANVPLSHVRTIYGVTGDLFAWMCVAATAIAIAYALLRSTLAVQKSVAAVTTNV